MSATYIKMYNQKRKTILLDTYVPQTSRSLAAMEKIMTYRLQYFISRLCAALKCIIDEPNKWDKAWVLDRLDVENVCMNSCLWAILIFL